ncbi:polyprotein [Mosavirus A2]|uniref:Genome polyprotein n=1 Tax=Mosavirus A2 isolate Coracias garrulus/Hungary/SZAL6-MoV/2011 TaxID=1554481 RepID=X2L6K2_9PICO|nr:polyprotein [Mosavirus A2]AHN95561.1 polyprotein [Mosavirus A2]
MVTTIGIVIDDTVELSDFTTIPESSNILTTLATLEKDLTMDSAELIKILESRCICVEEVCECSTPVLNNRKYGVIVIKGRENETDEVVVNSLAAKYLTLYEDDDAEEYCSNVMWTCPYEKQAFNEHMERFKHPEYRYAGFENFNGNCWFNSARQLFRLVGEPDLVMLFDQLPHNPDVIESFYKATRDILGWRVGTDIGGHPESLVLLLSRSWANDSEGAIYKHRYVRADADLGYWWDAYELPVMVLYDDTTYEVPHVRVVAKENDYWIVFDDDRTYCTKNWRHFGKPVVGSAGINMLQMVPAQWRTPKSVKQHQIVRPRWTKTKVAEIMEQPMCYMQALLIEHFEKDPEFNRCVYQLAQYSIPACIWRTDRRNFTMPRATDLLHKVVRQQLDQKCFAETSVYWYTVPGFKKASFAGNYDSRLPLQHLYRRHHEWFMRHHKLPVVETESALTQGGGQSKPQQGNVNGSQNQGINVYNYYNQQYQNSVDMSNAPLSVGGSGGGNQAASNHTNNSHMNFVTTGFNMASNLVPLMLMDPDTEDSTELPDRITEDTEGNIKVTTQSSVGTLVAYHQLRSKHQITSCAEAPTTGEPAHERNLVQYIGTWEQTQVEYVYLALPFPSGLEETGVFGVTANRHYTLKCGWKIQAKLNTSHFHAGCIGVWAGPEPSFLDSFQRTTTWQTFSTDVRPESLFLFPHQLINCRTNTSVDMILPYMNFVPTGAYGYHCQWALLFVVLTPLQIPTGASPTVDISATITPKDVVYNGLRQPQVAQGMPVHIRENQSMFATTIPDETTPVYGLGFNPTSDFVPGEVHNYLEWARTPCLISMVEDGSIRGYFTANNTRSDTPLLQMDVTIASDHVRYTPLGQLGYRYTQYRGSINVMLCFTGAAMVKGKFLLAYTPPGADRPNTIAEAMQATYAIWDLGLQSSYDFTIPFISVSDFRLCFSGTTSTLSVDGWFTVFQYTALTYPANTPQRSDVLVFVSAGQDFCYRNITEVREKTQGLDNAEEGASENPTAEEDFAAKPLSGEIQHTGLGFVFDRSWGLTQLTMPGKATATVPLTITELLNGGVNRELHWWLSALTYFKCDLEVTVMPFGNAPSNTTGRPVCPRVLVKFYPVGATVPTTDDNPIVSGGMIQNTGPVPLMVSGSYEPVSFVVPYTSPLSVIPTTYFGYADFERTALSNVAPGASFGTLRIATYSPDPMYIQVYIRLKNFKGYVPRPLKNAGATPTNSRAKLMVDEDYVIQRSAHRSVLLDGDVESNPGPVVLSVPFETARAQGLEGLYNWLSGGVFGSFADAAKHASNTVGQAEEAAAGVARTTNAFADIVENFRKLSDYAVDAVKAVKAWMTTVRKVLRMFCYLVIAYRTQDPVVIGLLGVDIAFGDPFDIIEIIKAKLKKFFTTPAPPLAQTQGVSDINAVFNMLKNGEWALKMILTVKDWLQRWINQEMEAPEKKLTKMMPELLDAIETLEKKDANAQKAAPKMIPIIQEAARLARMCNRTSIANYCDSVLKPYAMSGKQRTEPVVIVLKGKPGQGKTVAATLLAQMISKSLVGTQSVYSLPPDSKHMDGYNGQTVVIMDDLGQNPEGMDFATFCQMVSTTQFVTPQASLTDKGTCFTSPVIIATTNLGDFRPVTIADPGAVKRRIFLELDVSAGLKTPAGCLDLGMAMENCQDLGRPKPDCLQSTPKILHSGVLKLHETRINVTFSLLDVYEKVMRQLKQKEQMTDLLAGVVCQGLVITEESITGTVTQAEDQGRLITIYDIHKKKGELDNSFQEFVTMIALVPVFFSILTMAVNVITYLFGGKNEPCEMETQTEPEEEGPYCGACKRKAPVLKKTVAEGPYSGMPRATPKKLKKVVVQAREEQELKPRFVTITPEEIAETQGPRSDAEASLLERNTCPVIYMRNGKEVSSLTALKICNGKVLINKHQFDKDIWDILEIEGIQQTRDQCSISGFVTKKGVPYDLYVIDVPKMQCRDIRNMFVDEEPRCETLVGICNSTAFRKMMWHGEVLRAVEHLTTDCGILPKTIAYKTPTRAGFCGAPLTARRNGQLKIIAIHSAGNGVNGYGTLISRKMIEEATTQGIIYDERPGPMVAVNRKTQIKKSPLFDVFKPEAGTAVLSQYDRRLADGVVLDEALFEKHVSDMEKLPKEFEIACDMYANELFSKIGTNNGVVSMYRAMNGDGISEAMDMSKAVGYPYCLESIHRVDLIETKETPEGKVYFPTKRLEEETRKFFYGEEKPKFVTFLKDEVRSNEKIKQGKTRIVDASPFPYAIAGRMVMQNFMSNMMAHNGIETGSAVGCDPDVAWTRYFFELTDRYVFDLDYKAFDSTHPTAIFNLLADRFFLPKYGFDQEAVRIFLNGLSDSDHVYESKHFRIRGGLPSGCPCTSILNTVINNIIVRAAMLGAYQVDTIDFQNFKMLAYGDDVVYSTPQPIKPKDLADWLHSNTNYKVTPASKAGEFPDESTIWDVTFLKRAFIPDENHGQLIKPVMSMSNLKQMLSFMRPGTFPDKVRSVAGLAVHCSEEDYNELADAIESTVPGVAMPAYSYMKACWYAKMV